MLVDYAEDDPTTFERDLAEAVNKVAGDSALSQRMGAAGLVRAREKFSWATIAQETVDVYTTLL